MWFYVKDTFHIPNMLKFEYDMAMAERRKLALNSKSDWFGMQLLEDLRFTTTATKIKATPDGEYIIASGI